MSTSVRDRLSRRGHALMTLLLMGMCLTTLGGAPAAAEIRTVTGSGEYRMGDRDSREDAIRLATEAAKRSALEQVATYLESVTEVKELDVTKDEMRSYTAGMVLVTSQQVNTRLEGQTTVVRVDLTAQVDPEEVAQAIVALRQNQDAQQELGSLRADVEKLQQQLDATNQALATATSADEAQTLSQQRQQLLNQVQSNGLLSQAWTDWVLVTPTVGVTPWVGYWQVRALLAEAARLTPRSPHVRVVQQVINQTVVPPGMPSTPAGASPQPPAPSAPPPPHQTSPPAQVGQPPSSKTSPTQHQSPQVHLVPSPSPHLLPPPLHQYHPLPPTLHQIHPSAHPHVARMPFRLPPRATRASHSGGHHH